MCALDKEQDVRTSEGGEQKRPLLPMKGGDGNDKEQFVLDPLGYGQDVSTLKMLQDDRLIRSTGSYLLMCYSGTLMSI